MSRALNLTFRLCCVCVESLTQLSTYEIELHARNRKDKNESSAVGRNEVCYILTADVIQQLFVHLASLTFPPSGFIFLGGLCVYRGLY
jgi:hypothetical protein